MYALLPTMRGATYEVLKQALDEMKEFHGENRRRLAEQILLFDTFLQRTDTVPSEDKHKIQEYLNMFDSLLDESRFVRKKAAEAKAEGKAEGEIEALRQVVVEIVQSRFPSLVGLAQQKVTKLNEAQELHRLIMQVTITGDEVATREILDMVDA